MKARKSEDQLRFAAHPQAARDLLTHIPRLEPVAWMISQQLIRGSLQGVSGVSEPYGEDIVFGADILRVAVAFDNLRMKGVADEDAIVRLRLRNAEFRPGLIEAMSSIKPESATMELRRIPTAKLTAGMILQQEIRTKTGTLMVPKGQEITPALLIKLENFLRAGSIDHEIMALVPVLL